MNTATQQAVFLNGLSGPVGTTAAVLPPSVAAPESGAAVIDINPPNPTPVQGVQAVISNTNANSSGSKKYSEPLFGPSIGSVSTGPSWTLSTTEKKAIASSFSNGAVNGGEKDKDELTMDILNQWVEKSKDPSHLTTTLQALVNLKRPTLRLVPLSMTNLSLDGDATTPPSNTNPHAITFTYDCDAPMCAIAICVHVPRAHPFVAHYSSQTPSTSNKEPYTSYLPPVLPTSSSSSALAKVKLYETVKEGGFGRKLVVSDGAMVELAVWESGPSAIKKWGDLSLQEGTAVAGPNDKDISNNETLEVASPSPVANRASSSTPTPISSSSTPTPGGHDHKKRFSTLHFFKKNHGHGHSQSAASVAGPALAVVDAAAEAQNDDDGPANAAAAPVSAATAAPPTSPADKKKLAREKEDEDSVRMTIRVTALDEHGKELASANEQITYLSVVRFGFKETSKSAGGEKVKKDDKKDDGAKESEKAGEDGKEDKSGDKEKEDVRPWIVKVVKREATIGPHTFHLHEIYGLSSSSCSSDNAEPTAPHPDEHTYPPSSPVSGHVEDANSEASECLLCLSSPREVVLLPCRHLVACKECALNMVEFGAGGVVHTGGDDPPGGNANAASGAADTGAEAGRGAGTAPSAIEGQRRKRKAKGWFCPVCRQPYTSMLRLSTSAPPLPSPASANLKEKNPDGDDGDGDGSGTEDEDEGNAVNGLATTAPGGTGGNANATNDSQSGGFLRGTFLRGLSVGSALRLTSSRSQQGQPGDVESQPVRAQG